MAINLLDAPTATCDDPITPFNYALPNRASFQIPAVPGFNLNIVEFELPALELPPVARVTPFVTDLVPGDHINYGELLIKFIVSESYNNYLDIYYWMVGLGKPRDRSQYNNKPHHREDAVLLIRDANQSVVQTVKFDQVFPTRIDQINFNFEDAMPKPIHCVVAFQYTKFEFVPERF